MFSLPEPPAGNSDKLVGNRQSKAVGVVIGV